jgi:general secretion pathway protein D
MMNSKILRSRSAVALATLALIGCTAEKGLLPKALYSAPENAGNQSTGVAEQAGGGLVVTTPPVPPAPTRLSTVKKSPSVPDKVEAADISLSFDQIPLTSFIQVTFGTILKKNYNVDAAVAVRTDLVTLRTSTGQTPSQVLTTVTMLLKQYGISVTELGGFYRIAPDKDQGAYSPEIRRGRAQPDVPMPLRPIFNLVEMTAVRAPEVSALLKTMFGNKLNIQDNLTINSILISGQSADVNAALEAIQVLDQPMMRGRSSRRISPTSLSADELSKKLVEVLSAEGYSVTANFASAGGATPIVLIPAPTSNSLLAFAADPAILDHIVSWARQLDEAGNSGRRNGTYFTYPVKYADAQEVAKTMQEILASTAPATSATNTTGTAGAVAASVRAPSKIVVNAATNTLIFVCSQDQYSQLVDILRELDQPSKSALIEVTVAEVDINDQNSLGVQWALNGGTATTSTGSTAAIGQTIAGASATMGAGGLAVNYLSGSGKVSATISALAAVSKVTVLSTPRIMARNGETATIEVGNQVPIVTSQLSNANTEVAGTTGTSAGVLQTIQYLPTGVILKVKPIIHSGNRVELDVSQEVSTASSTTTGVSSSPTIATKKVDTKLSIRDGATVLLGGLMSTSDTKSDSGVPYLKDIPVLGQLFGTKSDQIQKTELIILITPYIIDDDRVAEQVTEAFRDQLGPWAQIAPSDPPKPKLVTPHVDMPTSTKRDSSPVAPPVVPPATTQETAAPDAPMPQPPTSDTTAPVGDAPSAQPGTKVTDPALLQELRNAAPAKAK